SERERRKKLHDNAWKVSKLRILLSAKILICFITLLLCLTSPAFAQPVNGGFETGDLTGWTAQGNVEVLQANNFNPSITPPEGKLFALLSTGPNNSPAPDNGDLDGDGNPDNDITILSQTFTSGAGTLSFKWGWLTDEEDEETIYDDFFMVRLDGIIILSGSVDKTPEQSPFPNISTDDIAYSVTSSGPTDGSYFGDGRSEFQTFSYSITAGTHTIEFVVADAGNHNVDSGLLVDDITVPLAPLPKPMPPVGGEVYSADKLAVLAPYVALIGLASVVAVAVKRLRR
ncbi:MAG: hypothetical protein QXE79_06500, partial [Candidatus Bathyarchaeia archaeon]